MFLFLLVCAGAAGCRAWLCGAVDPRHGWSVRIITPCILSTRATESAMTGWEVRRRVEARREGCGVKGGERCRLETGMVGGRLECIEEDVEWRLAGNGVESRFWQGRM